MRIALVSAIPNESNQIGFRVAFLRAPGAFDRAEFLLRQGQLKGYFDQFSRLKEHWEARLASVNAVLGSFNVRGT